MSLLRSNLVICSAAIANCIVALVTLGISGWSLTGCHAAARNSARFSEMCFVIAFAAPGLVRLVHGLPSGATLLWAWFAAHLVHFASVAILFASFERPHIAQHPGQTALVVLIGSSLVFGTALTITSHSRAGTVLHNVFLYAIFGIFTLAFARNQVVLLRVLAPVLILAFFLRLTAHFKPWRPTLRPLIRFWRE